MTKSEITIRQWAGGLVACAALAGAAGVMEAAGAAHGNPDPLLQTSANFLLLTAASTIGIAAFACAAQHRGAWFLIAGSVLLGGALLFCGDLTARIFLGYRLFPFAAPAGGTLMIVGWVAAALAALSSCFGSSRD
jgi:uncharacterized membrane protein YgdD (TMEM256/DUF423 family)